MQFSIRLRSGPLPRFARASIRTRRVFDYYRLRTETWGLEVQFDRQSSVCEDAFMQSGDADGASSPSITLCDAYSAIGDGGNSSPSLFVRELVSSMASLCCSCRHEALPVFRLLMRCLKYVLGKNSEEVIEVHVLGVQLVDTVLLLFHQKASCVMLNKGKHTVEVVSMLVTILQYQAYL
uniref:Uncharacterized protein n=1 Tax=Brassica oleracea var. oleracea TaxID=109376 RepID=A0A0D3E5I8_BRAOL